jgi:hypothetical protein
MSFRVVKASRTIPIVATILFMISLKVNFQKNQVSKSLMAVVA